MTIMPPNIIKQEHQQRTKLLHTLLGTAMVQAACFSQKQSRWRQVEFPAPFGILCPHSALEYQMLLALKSDIICQLHLP